MAQRRDQQAERDAYPGGNADGQAAELESAPAPGPTTGGDLIPLRPGVGHLSHRRDHTFLACTSRMDAAEGHRQKARSSGRSGRGTSWYRAPVTVTQRNPLAFRNSVSARRVNRRRWPATTRPGLPNTPCRLTSEKIGWIPKASST